MPGARETLEELRGYGIPIGVVSNCSFGQDVLRHELAQYGLADRVAFIMVSAEYAVRKPNPLIFEMAAAKLGVEPTDIWFAGDQLGTDIAGAKATGMTSVWFNPTKSEASDSADLTVASWFDLARLVRTVYR
jgi:putative hydrolase of the HAD superfamily